MTTVGAIRWDAWYADTGPAASTAAALTNADYLYRAPFFSEVSGRRVRFRPTEATMTREIALAASAGLYWAFLHYDENNPDAASINDGFDLFQANPNKNDVNWCSIIQPSWVANGGVYPSADYASRVDQIVSWMEQPNYQTVLSGRPLVYIFGTSSQITPSWGSDANFKVALDLLRSSASAADLEDPFIVVMEGTPTAAESRRVALGADAVTNYISRIPTGLDKTYAELTTAVEAYWAEKAAASNSIVPIVMCGWNKTPRLIRPVPWEAATTRPNFGLNNVHADPTTEELAAHFQAALDFVADNASDCPADTVLAYAWNEHDEGGWLCPTLGDPNGERIAAVGAVINGQ